MKPAPGMDCALNSDCAAGLTCTFGFCHTPCKVNGDCPTPQLCVKSDVSGDAGVAVNVCQLPKELNCVYNSNCMAPLVCARDEQCRNQCQADVDCVSPQVCTTSKVCALNSQLSPGTNDVPLVTAGQGGAAGSQATGTGGVGGVGGVGGAKVTPTDGGSSRDGSGDAATPPPSCVAGLAGFHPSNLPVSLALPKSLSITTLSGTATFDTDALAVSGGMDAGQWNTMTVTMSGGYEAAVAIFDTFTLAAGATLQITGKRPLILVANGNLEIDGTIVAVQSPSNGWSGGGPPAPSTPLRAGQCPLDLLAGGGGPAGAAMGAAGGGYCGRGGNGSALADGGGSPSPGGIPYGTATLVPLAGGSSGGSSNGSDTSNHGGGAIELVSGSIVTIGDNATINLGGGGTDPGYAVGGGSGGGILLEAPTVIVRGILTVNGGSGSAAGNGQSQPGQPSLRPAVGGGSVAGNGSAGANINGGDALLQSNPAGGGGGAGRIRINTGCGGSFKPSSGAIISPTSATTCFTTGPLD
jgi:hypothetical protein